MFEKFELPQMQKREESLYTDAERESLSARIGNFISSHNLVESDSDDSIESSYDDSLENADIEKIGEELDAIVAERSIAIEGLSRIVRAA